MLSNRCLSILLRRDQYCIVRAANTTLAVAYRQGINYMKESFIERVHHFVEDTLALTEILSDPANRAPLEAERALAEDWYRRSEGGNSVPLNQRPSVPDSVQPPWVSWKKIREYSQHERPQLPWPDGALTEFPFTTTCLLLELLGDNGDGNADATRRSRTRPVCSVATASNTASLFSTFPTSTAASSTASLPSPCATWPRFTAGTGQAAGIPLKTPA
ncbi:hypothetical protein BDV12DRAFT_200373 [Aspergillus spectabilis]